MKFVNLWSLGQSTINVLSYNPNLGRTILKSFHGELIDSFEKEGKIKMITNGFSEVVAFNKNLYFNSSNISTSITHSVERSFRFVL